MAEIQSRYRKLSNAYQREREEDLLSVSRQILCALSNEDDDRPVSLLEPAIVVAEVLTPEDTVMLATDQVLGIATIQGGPTSHSAILARALGIPAVAGMDPAIMDLPRGTWAALDGFSGRIWINPSPDVMAELEERKQRWCKQRGQFQKDARQPAVTRDGRRVTVAANVSRVSDAEEAFENGADAVGLLRTEFLYSGREEAPGEEWQMETLLRIAGAVPQKPVTVRTLDAGGDKEIPFLSMPLETNPYLGVRGIRLTLARPELFRAQLRAILRAGARADIRLMFPMIATVEDVERVLHFRNRVHEELTKQNVSHRWPIPTGIMIETPAAVSLMPSLAQKLDFFSIGTNDLTQYTFAAERGNAALSAYHDACHPVILRYIEQVVHEAHRHGKSVSLCGELAADPVAVPVLAGLGVDELSLGCGGIAHVKHIIGRLNFEDAKKFAKHALTLKSAAEVRAQILTF